MKEVGKSDVIKSKAFSLIRRGICASQVAMMYQQVTLLLHAKT
jgi:hypothetical protein